jgi:DNA-binding CsgD family transcriptional regulator/tetratricopeptide (TPR) repeat protein
MSLHKLSAGSGYDYLTRQVAALDATEKGHVGLASYYTERGETPGAWIGSGLAGIDGLNAGDAVTAEQMRALFGAGMHPLATRRLQQLAAADLTDTNIKSATLTLPSLSGGADRLVASRWGHGARFAPDLKAEGPARAVGAVVGIAASGPLVGRVAELAVLNKAIGRAAAGSVQVVAISGEGGIGKSRLASEGLRSAGARGFRTLESAAGRLQRDLSFAPIVEALRPLVAEAALVDGLSDLARLFDGLRVPPLVALGDPGLERTRMFEAVRVLIERASMRQPIAMLIDDVHWADPGTLALLHYVIRGLPRRRCLFLLTYRSDEASDELRALLSALQRAETLTVVELAGLQAVEVEDLAEALLAAPAPAALRDMLVRRSGGVPLFVRAIVLRLIETGALFRSSGRWVLSTGAGAEVPTLVSTLLRGKIEMLPPTARQVLDLLAVCGGVAEHVLLSDVADNLVEGVTGLRLTGLVAEDIREGSLWYRVVHPMLAEVAYDMLPLIVRRQLHAQLAGAVERLGPDDVRLLGSHVRAAGDQVDPAYALDVLVAATRADLARLAGEEACANASTGLDLARRLGRRDAAAELAGAYAEACELAGRVEDAFSAWVAAADSAADPRARARRLTRGGVAAWDLGRFAEAYKLLDTADRALSGVAVCAECVDVEEVRVRFAGRSGDLAGLDESIARLAALGRATGSRRSRAAMMYAQVGRALHTGRYLDGLRVADELTALARNEESVLVAEALLRPLSAIQLCWGDLAAARASAEEGIRLARQSGVPAVEIQHDVLLALVEVFAGHWPAALRRMSDDLSLAQRVGGGARSAAITLAGQGLVFARRGRLDEAADRVSEARRLFGRWSAADRHVFGLVDLVEGMIALARHEVDHAVAIAADAAHNPTIPPLAFAFLGEAQATAGDMEAAQHTASRLAALGPGAPYPAALAAWVSGLAAGARDDPARAVGALNKLDRAVAGFAELGMPYEEAVVRLDRTLVRSAARQPTDAVAVDVVDALEVLDRLEAKPQADRARAVLRQLGRRPATATRDHDQRRLSVREEEVARLVAQGLSNAEVGERLFISTRTVATHLQHIYRRLELPSRSALIRYVLEGSPAAEVTSRGSPNT